MTEFGDESVMQLTAIGGEYQDNSENLVGVNVMGIKGYWFESL